MLKSKNINYRYFWFNDNIKRDKKNKEYLSNMSNNKNIVWRRYKNTKDGTGQDKANLSRKNWSFYSRNYKISLQTKERQEKT